MQKFSLCFIDQEDISDVIYFDPSTLSRPGCSSADDECDDDLDTPETLRREASKPLEEVMASYNVPNINKLKNSERGAKPAFSYLRGRREHTISKSSDGSSSTANVQGSSSSNVHYGSSGASSETESVNGNSEDQSSQYYIIPLKIKY